MALYFLFFEFLTTLARYTAAKINLYTKTTSKLPICSQMFLYFVMTSLDYHGNRYLLSMIFSTSIMGGYFQKVSKSLV